MAAGATRRGFGVMALAALLPGCGWQPVYAPTSGQTQSAAAQGLAETEVMLIPERMGQILRNALQVRFERGGAAVDRRYSLAVSLGFNADGIGIQRDSTISRVRLTGTANWTLQAMDARRTTLTHGQARQVDGYNVINQQYFAADQEGEMVTRRMMDALAEQVTLQLAAWFSTHPPGSSG